MAASQGHKIRLSEMPLRGRHWYILAVASAEQIIGGALSTIVGIMIPLILLLHSPHLSSFEQGLMGASGLMGIACGSFVIGRLMDEEGYLFWFRLCPILIAAGSACFYFSPGAWLPIIFLFIIGLGVGGGYSLDSGYISELMPERWVNLFVGLAKASSSLGFIGGAAAGYYALLFDPAAAIWRDLIWFIGILGLVTFLFRIRWYESPRWFLAKGEVAQAEKAAREFMGPNAEVTPLPANETNAPALSWAEMFTGERLKKVILTGLTWACEGLGVYGFGVFLPILVMALGIQGGHETGIPKVMDSVRTTIFINIFIAAGFAIGLAVIHKLRIVALMGWTFIICAFSLAGLLIAFKFGWPAWFSFLCFILFYTALNAGPHLVTFILPARVYSVEERGAGMGIATMLGKVGAVAGVFFMPLMLDWGGVTLVLIISILVMGMGALISFVYGKKLKLL